MYAGGERVEQNLQRTDVVRGARSLRREPVRARRTRTSALPQRSSSHSMAGKQHAVLFSQVERRHDVRALNSRGERSFVKNPATLWPSRVLDGPLRSSPLDAQRKALQRMTDLRTYLESRRANENANDRSVRSWSSFALAKRERLIARSRATEGWDHARSVTATRIGESPDTAGIEKRNATVSARRFRGLAIRSTPKHEHEGGAFELPFILSCVRCDTSYCQVVHASPPSLPPPKR